MLKKFCPYCGEPLENECDCEYEISQAHNAHIQELETRQEESGFYTFQDVMYNYMMER